MPAPPCSMLHDNTILLPSITLLAITHIIGILLVDSVQVSGRLTRHSTRAGVFVLTPGWGASREWRNTRKAKGGEEEEEEYLLNRLI